MLPSVYLSSKTPPPEVLPPKRKKEETKNFRLNDSAKRVHSSITSLITNEENFIRLAQERHHVVIRPPYASEKDFLLTELYSGVVGENQNLTEQEFEITLNNQGNLKKGSQFHRIVALQFPRENQAFGFIHYAIHKTADKVNHCVIHSLDILSSHRHQHFGSLLLAFAIVEAQKEKCDYIMLRSTFEGNFLYAAFGFQPECNDEIPKGAWTKLPYLVKVKILHRIKEEGNDYLVLKLKDKIIKAIIKERLYKVFEHSQMQKSKEEIDFNTVKIPPEVYEWDIFAENSEDEYSSTK
jgi:ribosomal protein S18 acetylase RimI-like enzyme